MTSLYATYSTRCCLCFSRLFHMQQ